MIRLLITVTLLVCALVTPTLADPVIPVAEARFDFEDQDLGPIDLWGGLELTDALTGLRVTFDRVSNTFPVALPLEMVDLGDPSFGFGNRSLSPFANTVASEFVGYLRITIDTTNLFDPSLQVGRVDWDMGDYVPSDNDDLYIASTAKDYLDDPGGVPQTTNGYVERDNGGYAPPFGSSTYTLIRAGNITQFWMFGGTGAAGDAPNSVFYDNFVFSLVTPGSYSRGDEVPISNFTGGGLVDSLGPQDGPNGGTPTAPPIPEPGTLFGVAAGLIALAIRARRRR